MVRGLDHIVLAVNDLDEAGAAYEKLGFTVTPQNNHPWGTSNRLVQLDSFFLELLSVTDASLFEDVQGNAFSFGAFNKNFLEGGEGPSMLVLESRSPEQDREDFKKAGLKLFDPFSFSRVANYPDGSTASVGFDLTILKNPLSPNVGYFTCYNKFPDNFWKPAFQAHGNGASSVKAVYMISKDPSDHHEFLGGFTGQREMRATSLGLELETTCGTISVLTPRAFASQIADYSENELSDRIPKLAALEIECVGLKSKRVVPADELFGLTLILSPAS